MFLSNVHNMNSNTEAGGTHSSRRLITMRLPPFLITSWDTTYSTSQTSVQLRERILPCEKHFDQELALFQMLVCRLSFVSVLVKSSAHLNVTVLFLWSMSFQQVWSIYQYLLPGTLLYRKQHANPGPAVWVSERFLDEDLKFFFSRADQFWLIH